MVKLNIYFIIVFSFLISAKGICSDLLVLVPGAFSSGSKSELFLKSYDYFFEYRKFFSERGFRVLHVQFPPDGTIEERALILKHQVEVFRTKNPIAKTFIIAHSQGGLDARFAIKTLGLTGISALATIGTPHQGTPLAVWTVKQRDARGFLYYSLKYIASYDLEALRFVPQLTSEFLTRFGEKFASVVGVRYGSARGNCITECNRALALISWWIGMKPGDGLVPLESQSFGDDLGEYDLDHISEIGADRLKKDQRSRLISRMFEYFTAP